MPDQHKTSDSTVSKRQPQPDRFNEVSLASRQKQDKEIALLRHAFSKNYKGNPSGPGEIKCLVGEVCAGQRRRRSAAHSLVC